MNKDFPVTPISFFALLCPLVSPENDVAGKEKTRLGRLKEQLYIWYYLKRVLFSFLMRIPTEGAT